MTRQIKNKSTDIPLSIAHKLRRMMMLVSGTALLVAALVYSIYGALSYYDATIVRLSTMSKIIGTNSSAALSFSDPLTATQLLSALDHEPDIKQAMIFDKQGNIFAQFVRQDMSVIEQPMLPQYIAAGDSRTISALNFDHIDVFSSIVFDGATLGYIQLSASLKPLYFDMLKILILALLLLLIGFLVVYSLAERLQREFSNPVIALVSGMKKVAQTQNYALQLDVLSQDEFGQLTHGFNDMLQQLEKRDQALKDKTQEAVQLAAKAEQANQSKSRFLANMSHEIRTPLNGVIGLLRRMTKTSLSPEERMVYLHSAQQASNDLLALLNDILDFSKIEADALQLEHAAIHVESFIQSALISLAPMAEEKGIQLKVELKAMPTKLMSDPLRMRQILINLVGNAVKFTASGEVSVSMTSRQPLQDQTKGWIDVAIADTGVGMNSNQLEKIFLAFTQADESTTRKHGGTGLGLNIAKRLIEIMGGHLQVSSEPDKGSVFSFAIPVDMFSDVTLINRIFDFKDVEVHPQQHAVANTLFQGKKVLLAEDNAINQLIAKEELEDMGLVVSVANDGKQAVEIWQQGGFDLILMDVQMPEMDGLEASQKIRELERGSGLRMPIVALTANAMKEDLQRCLDAGMDDYVTKPFQPHQLAAKLKVYLHGEAIHTAANEQEDIKQTASAHKQGQAFSLACMPPLHEQLLDVACIMQYEKSAAKLLKRVRDSNLEALSLLDQAAANASWLEFGRIAHKLIGSCMLMKGAELPKLLRVMQNSAAAGDAEACTEQLEILRPYLYKASDEAREYLAQME